jgi:hypothetical protein
MYMGGEDDNAVDASDIKLEENIVPLEDLNVDDLERTENGYLIMSMNKLKEIPDEEDWVKQKSSFISALFGCKLRPNDYQFVISLVVCVASWAVLLVGLLMVSNGNLGAITCMPLIYLFLCIF